MPHVKVISVAGRENLVLRWLDPITGQWKQRTAGTANRRRADRVAADLEAEIAAGKYSTRDISWSDFRTRYEEEQAVFLGAKTQGIASTAMNQLEVLLRPKRLADVTTAALSTLQARMKNAGLRDATIGGYLGHISAALKWSADIGLLAKVPRVRRLRGSKGRDSLARGRPLTQDEFDAMLAKVPDVRPGDAERWKRYLTGLWLSGLRLGESLALGWDDAAAIKVDLSGRHPRFRIWAEAEKGRRDRLLAMTPDFAELILKTPDSERRGLVFPLGRQPGEQMTDKRVSRAITEIGRMAGVIVNQDQDKPASAHDMRRSFATRWASRVMPALLQKLLRHASIETTLKYYVGLDADDMADGLWQKWGDGER
ncbi:MAG TPA: tyrosine-type recombinase/integrase [Pirellulales bacterium]|jgi:integrase